MSKLSIALTVIISLLLASAAQAESKAGKKLLYEKYAKQLETATSARDSVRILYTLFDLSDRKGQLTTGWEILNTAKRADNVTARIDMLRTLATFYSGNDSVIGILLSLTNDIPNERSRTSTKTYILNQHLGRKNRRITDPNMQRTLLDSLLKSHDLNGSDIYDQISALFQIIQFLGVDADGVLFRECLDSYERLMDELPASDYPLKNQFYTTAALIHSRLNGNPQKAILFDHKLLDIIGQLQEMYRKNDRRFRNYDANKFISYRRILSNYHGLAPDELEEIHDSILVLYDRNPDVRKTIARDGHASGFYYMATKDYKKALPLIKEMFHSPYLSSYQRQKYYKMMMEASKEVGDEKAYIEAMENFIQSSKEIDSIRTRSIEKESIVRDSILAAPLLYSIANTHSKEIGRNYSMDTILITVSCVLALLLIIYATLIIRLKIKTA